MAGVKVVTTSGQAAIPSRAHLTDVGHDLLLIERLHVDQDEVGKVTYFDTGVILTPSAGYYIQIVARSSLMKHGYMLANGVGIIDPGYTGTIQVGLYKFEDKKDLELPFSAVQAIICEYPKNVSFMRAAKPQRTERGSGGFGSSGSRVPSSGSQSVPGTHQPTFDTFDTDPSRNFFS